MDVVFPTAEVRRRAGDAAWWAVLSRPKRNTSRMIVEVSLAAGPTVHGMTALLSSEMPPTRTQVTRRSWDLPTSVIRRAGPISPQHSDLLAACVSEMALGQPDLTVAGTQLVAYESEASQKRGSTARLCRTIQAASTLCCVRRRSTCISRDFA